MNDVQHPDLRATVTRLMEIRTGAVDGVLTVPKETVAEIRRLLVELDWARLRGEPVDAVLAEFDDGLGYVRVEVKGA